MKIKCLNKMISIYAKKTHVTKAPKKDLAHLQFGFIIA